MNVLEPSEVEFRENAVHLAGQSTTAFKGRRWSRSTLHVQLYTFNFTRSTLHVQLYTFNFTTRSTLNVQLSTFKRSTLSTFNVTTRSTLQLFNFTPQSTVCNLGIHLDSQLTMKVHVQRICRTSYSTSSGSSGPCVARSPYTALLYTHAFITSRLSMSSLSCRFFDI